MDKLKSQQEVIKALDYLHNSELPRPQGGAS